MTLDSIGKPIKSGLVAVALCLQFFSPLAFALDAEENRNVTIYEKAAPAVVTIAALLETGPNEGAGVIIDSRGIILTSSHVVKNPKILTVSLSNNHVYSARLIATDLGPKKEIALLQIQTLSDKERFPTLSLAKEDNLRVGQKVLAIGNPYGLERTLTLGIVSRLDKALNTIQTDAPLNPGNSGGPLLNTDGEVIGISQSIFNPQGSNTNIGIGFASGIEVVKPFIAPQQLTLLMLSPVKVKPTEKPIQIYPFEPKPKETPVHLIP